MKNVTGLFDDYSDASAAVSALEARGIPSNDISIVSNNADGKHGERETNASEGAGTGAGIGAVLGGAGGLLTGLGLMAIPGVGPVVAAGWLAATAAGAVAGAVAGGAAGGLIGALTSSGVPEEHAHVYAEGVRRGGTLVTAKVDDSLRMDAEAILKKSNWVDPVERRHAYSQQGWTKFDDTAQPYGAAEIEQETRQISTSFDLNLKEGGFAALLLSEDPANGFGQNARFILTQVFDINCGASSRECSIFRNRDGARPGKLLADPKFSRRQDRE